MSTVSHLDTVIFGEDRVMHEKPIDFGAGEISVEIQVLSSFTGFGMRKMI